MSRIVRSAGLGVYLVRELMDEASYRRENDKNVVTLIKHKPS